MIVPILKSKTSMSAQINLQMVEGRERNREEGKGRGGNGRKMGGKRKGDGNESNRTGGGASNH
jgi:hypothetical protein